MAVSWAVPWAERLADPLAAASADASAAASAARRRYARPPQKSTRGTRILPVSRPPDTPFPVGSRRGCRSQRLSRRCTCPRGNPCTRRLWCRARIFLSRMQCNERLGLRSAPLCTARTRCRGTRPYPWGTPCRADQPSARFDPRGTRCKRSPRHPTAGPLDTRRRNRSWWKHRLQMPCLSDRCNLCKHACRPPTTGQHRTASSRRCRRIHSLPSTAG